VFVIGQAVRLADRTVQGADGKERVIKRGTNRVGTVAGFSRALSGDGKAEVQNVAVRFPAVTVKGRTLAEMVEVHEAGALEAA
jgi:hypothetical protein